MAQEKEIKNFVFNYTDGTSETVEKGFFCKIEEHPEDGTSTLSFEMAGVAGRDLAQIVIACVQLGDRLGLFKKKESEEISE